MGIRGIFPILLGTFALAAPAEAAETVSYSYDATGSINAGETRDAMAKGTREILERIRNCNSQREREQQC